jgi:hypothetical protein
MAETVEYALKELAKHNGEKGTCWDEPSNLERLNRAEQLIFRRGDFTDTMEWCHLRVINGILALPYHLEAIRKCWPCMANVEMGPAFYMQTSKACIEAQYTVRTAPRPLIITKEQNPKPYHGVFHPGVLQFVNEDEEDDGVELAIKVVEKGTLRHIMRRVTLEGIKGVSMDSVAMDMLEVTKPITKGNVTVWRVRDNGTKDFITSWMPKHKNPRFTRYRLNPNCRCGSYVNALVKRRHIDYVDMDELVVIQSMEALRYAYIATTATDSQKHDEHVAATQIMDSHMDKEDLDLCLSEPTMTIKPEYDNLVE